MKVLFLTDFPPCKEFTGGLVIDRLFRFLPPSERFGFFIVNADIPAKESEDLEMVSVRVTKPKESAERPYKGLRGEWHAFCSQTKQKLVTSKELAAQVEDFVRQHRIDAIWAIIEGQTLVRVTLELEKRLKIPIHTMVWDSIDWWLRENKIDKFTQFWVNKDFDQVIKLSRSCATASWAMSNEYNKRYKVRCVPVISSIPAELACRPAAKLKDEHSLTIALAGQLYSLTEWTRLIDTLESIGWLLNGRSVRLKLLGNFPSPVPNEHLDYLGHMSQADAIKFLSEVDLCFCPYPFSDEMRLVSNTSFPSKLTTYLAAGRPTLFHGPVDSSPARFIADHKVGIIAGSPNQDCLLDSIKNIVEDRELYRDRCLKACEAFDNFFTLEKMHEAFYDVLHGPNHVSKAIKV